tara:strand:- start:1606 stop:1794 length:189 start_codon:yes stop_codon:yes gene_type:complete
MSNQASNKNHSLVGKRVRWKKDEKTRFTVSRVVQTRFGSLATVKGDERTAYAIHELVVIEND